MSRRPVHPRSRFASLCGLALCVVAVPFVLAGLAVLLAAEEGRPR